MIWSFESADARFHALVNEWDAINNSQYGHILLDSKFVAALLRHFGGPHVMLAINQTSGRTGAALLVEEGKGVWSTFQPAQAPLGLMVLGYCDQTNEGLRNMLNSLPGYALQLSVTQQDPDFPFVPRNPGSMEIEFLDYVQTARLRLIGTFEEYWRCRSKNLKHNLDRQRRRLREKGHRLELQTERDAGQMAGCAAEYGALESSGWKGKEGTAVHESNSQGRFYREVLEAFAERGEASVYRLKIDGKLVASDLCLERNGMQVILKTAYDEHVEGFSPALLMRQDWLQQAFADGQIRVIEFYGRVLDWHTKWADEIRTMYHVNLFRSAWVARARRLVKQIL